MAGTRHDTKSHPVSEPPRSDVRRFWLLIVLGLLVTALVSLSFKPVCYPDKPGMTETTFGVRHQQRGTTWYHCEPWVRRVLTR
jgi:hypothetical protein